MKLSVLTGAAVGMLVAVVLSVSTVCAQVSFDPAMYKQMADASSSETIPIGTKITLQNWTQYQKFLPVYLQVLFAGKYPIKFGPEPEYNITVGPTEKYPYIKQFLADTEKFNGQTRLVQVPEGGYTIAPLPQDTAGLPFGLNPTQPLLGYKLLYNWWLNYQPRSVDFFAYNWLADRYNNISITVTDDVFYRLSHMSETGAPVNLPYSHGYLNSGRFLVVTPEQSRYTTQIELAPADPAANPESYVFLPSLRRALRLSAAAKCSPILGTDFINEDVNFQLPYFKVEALGEKKLLWPIMDPKIAQRADAYMTNKSGIMGWPTPQASHWQLRDMYILELEPLPVLGSYCYAHKILYIDKDGFFSDLAEEYDHGGKYWRVNFYRHMPVNYLGQTTLTNYAGGVNNGVTDFQGNHQTIAYQYNMTIGPEVPEHLQDAASLAFPGSLAQIMK
jgi:uncharacterized protein DUF1329